jgi:uncharacterized linocin/CFP29 family protein
MKPDYLRRSYAPLSEHVWKALDLTCIETVAAQTLTPEAICLLIE